VRVGMHINFLSMPYRESDGGWSRWYIAGDGKSMAIRPNQQRGYSSACLARRTDGADVQKVGPLEEQKQTAIDQFEQLGWEAGRILDEIRKSDADFYSQELVKARSKSLSNGRVVLLGDAGYCPTPLSGQGTTIALIGAYVLAGCIATHDNVEEALAQYETEVKPFIEQASIPPGAPWLIHPWSALGLRVLNNLVWSAGLVVNSGVGTALGKLGKLLPTFGSKRPTLPEYACFSEQRP
jgi:hypothetical protein